MSDADFKQNPAFVLVHGAWHGGACWARLVAALNAAGFAALAPDLPGAGGNAASPLAFSRRPLDTAAFATEPSPNAAVSQDQRNDAILAAVDEAAALGNGKVILVGHSLGGITVSPVVEAAPEKVAAAVYLCAFMLPPGMPAVAMILSEIMAEALVPPLFMADPEQVGALRIDVGSQDATYVQGIRDAFYGDLSDQQFEQTRSQLHCDEPVSVAAVPSNITPQRFGTVPRHYIQCLHDRAIPIAGQDHMIASVDDAIGGKTTIHSLSSSHSPFQSKVGDLTAVLESIASSS
ncbi:alpha/beta fold hydrolase [Shimia biformata]|uniref:alpha/beta fold hydrolase n=1 Tax=Shimia biformata TaxID=1294299 RepID=UPI0019513564|nr:alpha/beta fold hydrolase [Shimia biformata]